MSNSNSITWQKFFMDSHKRMLLMGHRSLCVWITGLSGSGKSTLANHIENLFFLNGAHTYLLDGDNIRHGLNQDLGFHVKDRSENIRRVAEVAKLMTDAGLITIVCTISPFKKDREMARQIFEADKFIEVYVETPIETCEARDPKGLYAKARSGELKNFTGIDSPYEKPEHPEITINTKEKTIEECGNYIYNQIMIRHLPEKN